MNLVALGTNALDSVETPFGKKDEILGGSTVFFSLAARFFSECGIVGVVGKDFPDERGRPSTYQQLIANIERVVRQDPPDLAELAASNPFKK